jgi:CDP-diacylglycerol--glycerol-3-phosphate 3-phosphatidyltransferase
MDNTTSAEQPVPENLWNIPNALAAFRLVGSAVLIGLTLAGITRPFVPIMVLLLMSDWLDGKLAILWKQQTIFGARLDSVADAAMYAALLFGAFWLKWEFVKQEWIWIAAVLVSYAVTMGAGLLKYGRMPSYHTRAAKTSWLLVGIAMVVVFANGPVWPFRLAMFVAVLTNIEATIMTTMLPRWHTNVPSLWHARRLSGAESEGRSEASGQPVNDEGK